eukprot:1022123-Heterocapsa_arctica.AAC.1
MPPPPAHLLAPASLHTAHLSSSTRADEPLATVRGPGSCRLPPVDLIARHPFSQHPLCFRASSQPTWLASPPAHPPG